MQAVPSRLGRLAALPAQQRRTLVTAAVLLPVAALALRVAGWARLHRWLGRANGTPCAAQLGLARETAALIEIASRNGPFMGTCLSRSLVLAWLLRRRGIASELRIGVRLAQGRLEAHAWVACGGLPVNDTPEAIAAFEPLDRAAA